jgi:hypothetical protein
LLVYGLNVDKTLDTVKVEPAAVAGDSAKVKITYTAFDKPFTTEGDLVKVDNKWFSKQAIEQWNKRQQEEAAAQTTQPTAPTAQPAK